MLVDWVGKDDYPRDLLDFLGTGGGFKKFDCKATEAMRNHL